MTKQHSIKCPICGDKATHKEIGENKSTDNGHTNIYVCGACPFIGVEFYNRADTENLSEYLNRDFNAKTGRIKPFIR